MKILCPEHRGFINISSKIVDKALNSPLKVLVTTCPICDEEVMMENIQPDEAVASRL
jgi:hypothetical protein